MGSQTCVCAAAAPLRAAGRLIRALPVPLPASFLQPEPVKFPRKTLDQRFAVLLMRSSYDAVDALDFIPMDKFEVGAGGTQPVPRRSGSSFDGSFGANLWGALAGQSTPQPEP